jgi:hypothetical protein
MMRHIPSTIHRVCVSQYDHSVNYRNLSETMATFDHRQRTVRLHVFAMIPCVATSTGLALSRLPGYRKFFNLYTIIRSSLQQLNAKMSFRSIERIPPKKSLCNNAIHPAVVHIGLHFLTFLLQKSQHLLAQL